VTDDTRARILRVSLDLFASRGYHATSVREIAERLDLTKTAVLYHFPSKRDIVAALADPLLSEMEAAVVAAQRPGLPDHDRRWGVLEGLLDAFLQHRYLLRMTMRDLALATDGPVFHRFRDTMMLAHHLIAGPVVDHTDRIHAAQALAMLSDPVVLFADLPVDLLRPAVLAGVHRLLDPGPDGPGPHGPGPHGSNSPPARKAVRRGRPESMTPEKVAEARRLHAEGTRTAAEIAAALGVSRATLYRHL
jgi:AcrR family transcriptional regulator